MTQFLPEGQRYLEPIPVEFELEPVLERNRLTTLFRWLLLIPHLIFATVAGLAMYVIVILGWFCALVLGRMPAPFASYIEGFLRYYGRLLGYTSVLTDAYPPFSFADREYPIRVTIARGRLNRWAVLFRLILVVPAYLIVAVLSGGFFLFTVVSWVLGVFLGRTPKAIYEASYVVQRYTVRTVAYLTMATSTYPWGWFGDAAYTPSHLAAMPVTPTDAAAAVDPWAAPPAPAAMSSAMDVAPVGAVGPSSASWSVMSRVTLSGGSKAILIVSLVLGLGLDVARFGLSGFASGNLGATLTASRGYSTYAGHIRSDAATWRACRDAICLQTAYQGTAADVRAFETTVKSLHVSSHAEGARQTLAASLETLAVAFDNVSRASTQAEFISLGALLQAPANQVDANYSALISALRGF